MEPKQVYIGLGGNIGNTQYYLTEAAEAIKALEGTSDFQISRYYQTTPVSTIQQRDYVNAACRFYTTLTAEQLLVHLKQIESKIGKTPKDKEAPRVIDLDILLFGLEVYQTDILTIPHPFWEERLFVLVPLSDITESINVPTCSGDYKVIFLPHFIANHTNPHNETITLLETKELDHEKC